VMIMMMMVVMVMVMVRMMMMMMMMKKIVAVMMRPSAIGAHQGAWCPIQQLRVSSAQRR
jgi:hypothetical protein